MQISTGMPCVDAQLEGLPTGVVSCVYSEEPLEARRKLLVSIADSNAAVFVDCDKGVRPTNVPTIEVEDALEGFLMALKMRAPVIVIDPVSFTRNDYGLLSFARNSQALIDRCRAERKTVVLGFQRRNALPKIVAYSSYFTLKALDEETVLVVKNKTSSSVLPGTLVQLSWPSAEPVGPIKSRFDLMEEGF